MCLTKKPLEARLKCYPHLQVSKGGNVLTIEIVAGVSKQNVDCFDWPPFLNSQVSIMFCRVSASMEAVQPSRFSIYHQLCCLVVIHF